MQVEQIGIETLIPYANNARTHSEAQVAQIAASIREFGFNNPVLIDEQSSIIAGHGRVLAAIRAGRTFSASRKLGKTHQNILVFVKGDGKKAAAACGLIEIDESLFDDIDPISLDESDLSGVDT